MKRLWHFIRKACSELLVLPIRLYQKCISPLIPPRCRFSPTCSCYAVQALRRFGPIRGSLLTVCRQSSQRHDSVAETPHENGNGGPST